MYKQNKITELVNLYNASVRYLNNALVTAIRNIQSSYSRNKQAQINASILKYNVELANLKTALNNTIRQVNDYQPTMQSSFQRRKALLIGCNYSNTPYALTGCIRDSEQIQAMLAEHSFDQFQMMNDHSAVKPTKPNILREFKNLLMNASPGDLLFFYFSGHGSFVRDMNNDETDGKDELIVSSDLQGITDDELKSLLNAYMKEGVVLVSMFDSCHSGTMLDLKYMYLDSTNYDAYTENKNATECKGDVIMISGCMDAQTSAEAIIDNQAQGALTWSFLESLKLLPKASWRECIKRMRVLLKEAGHIQIPQLSSGAFENIDATIPI